MSGCVHLYFNAQGRDSTLFGSKNHSLRHIPWAFSISLHSLAKCIQILLNEFLDSCFIYRFFKGCLCLNKRHNI